MPERWPLYPVQREHLEALSDEIGIMQHAVGARRDPAHGYCTDDMARALLVDLAHGAAIGWAAVAPSVARDLRFLQAAFEPGTGRFRNLMTADGAWLPAPFSEDAHARAMRALGEMIAATPDRSLRAAAIDLFEQALPVAGKLRQWRPQAAVLLGCDAALRGGLAGATLAVHGRLAAVLRQRVDEARTEPAWPWPETTLTYENGLLPEALLIAGRRLDERAMIARGRRLLDWLIEVEVAAAGHLSVIGNEGWWPRGGARARYDQQPIEVTALLQAAEAGASVTGDDRYEAAMEQCYGWFLGANDRGVEMALPGRGACQDGLTPTGPNPNQGAESTLMWLLAVEAMRRLRAPREVDRGPPVLVGGAR